VHQVGKNKGLSLY